MLLISVTALVFVAYLFFSSRRLDRQLEQEIKRARYMDRIIFLERLLLNIVIEEAALDIYDPEIQDILRRLIIAQRRYMEMYGVDWEADIQKKIALLREV